MILQQRKFESALRWQVLQWIQSIEKVDILVGIPCYNNEETISGVVRAVGEGLDRYFKDLRCGILVSDGGSLDDTREKAYEAKIPSSVHRRVSIYRGLPGKGTSFRAIFEAAKELEARAVVVLDSDLRSITPEWIHLLTTPILENQADFVAPLYSRHKHDSTITNMIAYPLIRALFGLRVRQPIGGDFGFAGELARFYAEAEVWETDITKFGIDIWMILAAICADKRIVQVFLGTKVHDAKDPAADLSQMFCQVVSTLFFVVTYAEERIKASSTSRPVSVVGKVEQSFPLTAIEVQLKALDKEFLEGIEQFDPMYEHVLDQENYDQLKQLQASGQDFPVLLWARVLYDFLSVYRVWNRNRRRLVDMLVPLYFGRLASYCRQVATLTSEEAEQVIEHQAAVFEQEKSYYLQRLEEESR